MSYYRNQCAYYYKPKTKYPARIYLLMNSEEWNTRNMIPMGISKQPKLFGREMTEIEIQEKPKFRSQYFQYETLESLMVNEFKCEVDFDLIQSLYNKITQSTIYKLADKHILSLPEYLAKAEKELGFKLDKYALNGQERGEVRV